jgi:molybdenum cofactor cytidylyltransferase
LSEEAQHKPVAAVILAAGRSSRMGPRNKLLIHDGQGRTMIGRVVVEVLASQASEVVVVTGHQADAVGMAARLAASGDCRLRIVKAPDFARGLSASLKMGIQALQDPTAALVCLGDMPLVTSTILDKLIAAHNSDSGKTIIVPTCGGQRGNPVLWDRHFFSAIAGLSGDQGARLLLSQHAADVAELECHDEAVLRDFDTPDALGQEWGDPLG